MITPAPASVAAIGSARSDGSDGPVQPIMTGFAAPNAWERRLEAHRDGAVRADAARLPHVGTASGLILRADPAAECPPDAAVEAHGTLVRMAVLVCVVLHLGALPMVVQVAARLVPLLPEVPQLRVERVFIQQPRTMQGAPAKAPDAALTPGTAPAAGIARPAFPAATAAAQPIATPDPTAGATAPHRQASMLDDLGNMPHDDAAYSDSSDDVRPTRPDGAYRNMSPRSPGCCTIWPAWRG